MLCVEELQYAFSLLQEKARPGAKLKSIRLLIPLEDSGLNENPIHEAHDGVRLFRRHRHCHHHEDVVNIASVISWPDIFKDRVVKLLQIPVRDHRGCTEPNRETSCLIR